MGNNSGMGVHCVKILFLHPGPNEAVNKVIKTGIPTLRFLCGTVWHDVVMTEQTLPWNNYYVGYSQDHLIMT